MGHLTSCVSRYAHSCTIYAPARRHQCRQEITHSKNSTFKNGIEQQLISMLSKRECLSPFSKNGWIIPSAYQIQSPFGTVQEHGSSSFQPMRCIFRKASSVLTIPTTPNHPSDPTCPTHSQLFKCAPHPQTILPARPCPAFAKNEPLIANP